MTGVGRSPTFNAAYNLSWHRLWRLTIPLDWPIYETSMVPPDVEYCISATGGAAGPVEVLSAGGGSRSTAPEALRDCPPLFVLDPPPLFALEPWLFAHGVSTALVVISCPPCPWYCGTLGHVRLVAGPALARCLVLPVDLRKLRWNFYWSVFLWSKSMWSQRWSINNWTLI